MLYLKLHRGSLFHPLFSWLTWTETYKFLVFITNCWYKVYSTELQQKSTVWHKHIIFWQWCTTLPWGTNSSLLIPHLPSSQHAKWTKCWTYCIILFVTLYMPNGKLCKKWNLPNYWPPSLQCYPHDIYLQLLQPSILKLLLASEHTTIKVFFDSLLKLCVK